MSPRAFGGACPARTCGRCWNTWSRMGPVESSGRRSQGACGIVAGKTKKDCVTFLSWKTKVGIPTRHQRGPSCIVDSTVRHWERDGQRQGNTVLWVLILITRFHFHFNYHVTLHSGCFIHFNNLFIFQQQRASTKNHQEPQSNQSAATQARVCLFI